MFSAKSVKMFIVSRAIDDSIPVGTALPNRQRPRPAALAHATGSEVFFLKPKCTLPMGASQIFANEVTVTGREAVP